MSAPRPPLVALSELASGQRGDFFALLSDRTRGLTSAGKPYFHCRFRDARRAVSYMGSGARLKRADETLPLSGTSAGGGYSTVGDFHRFINGLTSHRLLRAETLQRLIDGGIKTEDGQFAGFDFGDADTERAIIEGAGPA